MNIPESDIGRLFSGCTFTDGQQDIFMDEYYQSSRPSAETVNRILCIKITLDFFRIIENYCIHKGKTFDADAMIRDLEEYRQKLRSMKNRTSP